MPEHEQESSHRNEVEEEDIELADSEKAGIQGGLNPQPLPPGAR